MQKAVLRARDGMLLLAVILMAPVGALATPLVQSMQFDAFYQTESPLGGPPNGGTYDYPGTDGVAGGGPGDLAMDGRVTSVTVNPGSITKGLVVPDLNVKFHLDATLASHSFIPLGGTLFLANSTFVSNGGLDWSMTQGNSANVILNGTFAAPLTISGVIDVNTGALTVNQLLSGTNLSISNGHADLVAALGGTGANAILDLKQAIFNFVPTLPVLGADLNLYNSDFTFAASGQITPLANAPFVPEPGTALLLGTGLIGLMAAGRRIRR
jgi:hypothetical protein